jgi:hypothetical protein
MKLATALAALATLSIAACANMQGRQPETSETLVSATATIDAVDKEQRIVSLHGDETGQRFTVYANDGIRNLEQLEAGDVVVVEYYEAATLAMADATDPDASASELSAGAPKGALPGALEVQSQTLVVEVVNYDAENGIATYRTSDGLTRRAAVPPELQSFVAETSRGDLVEVTLTQAIAVSIDEVES